MKDRVWTISNGLSFLRILLIVPIGFFLLSEKDFSRWWAAGLMAVAILTDTLDGLIARALNQETDVGKILDPLADKLGVAIVSLLLMMKGALPVWFFSLAIVRDLAILSGGLYVKKKRQTILQSNTMGKWTVGVVALLLVVSVIHLDALQDVKNILLVLSTILLTGSFALYAGRFFKTIPGPG